MATPLPRLSSSTRYGLTLPGGRRARHERDRRQLDGVLRLLRVARALLESEQRPAGLWVVTADAYATGIGAEQPSPEQALVAGLAMALPDQHPGFPCAHIDLALSEGIAPMAEIVLRELDSRPTPGSIAWRAGRRLDAVARAPARRAWRATTAVRRAE